MEQFVKNALSKRIVDTTPEAFLDGLISDIQTVDDTLYETEYSQKLVLFREEHNTIDQLIEKFRNILKRD
jgi:hypothetical protein